jgi:hypothetical protein
MRERQIYAAIEEMTPTRDKLARSRSIMARAAIQPIRVPAFMRWWPDALEQLLKFPNATHDDFVDWLSWIGIGLERLSSARPARIVRARDYRVGSAPWVIAQARAERKVLEFKRKVAGM